MLGDLKKLVNELRLAGAEAISINDVRITSMSDFKDIAPGLIVVNGQHQSSPYVIKAIGNQSYLESALIGNGGHVDELKKLGYEATIEKENKVIITKYNGEIKTKYIE